jgi:hypothetical protein
LAGEDHQGGERLGAVLDHPLIRTTQEAGQGEAFFPWPGSPRDGPAARANPRGFGQGVAEGVGLGVWLGVGVGVGEGLGEGDGLDVADGVGEG